MKIHITQQELDGLKNEALVAHIKERMAESGETDMVMTPLAYANLRLLDRTDEVEFIAQKCILETGLFALVGDYRVFVSRDAGKA